MSSGNQYSDLIRDDRVHRSIYVDPEIFEAEQDRIFRKTWLYVGHDSLIPNVGDYYCTTLAGESVVMSRHRDGQVYVLFNRCGHRGARVLQDQRGNAKLFSCMYHGWTFQPNGALNDVPMRRDYPACALKESASGMVRLPKVEVYRGFVFASFNPTCGPSWSIWGLPEPASTNWSIGRRTMPSNSGPAAIATCFAATGSSSSRTWRICIIPPRRISRRSGMTDGNFSAGRAMSAARAQFFAPNGEAIVAQTGVRGYPNGHSSEASLFREEQAGGEWDEYRALLEQKHGSERTTEILRNRRHSMTLFPNVDILIAQLSIRVVRPIAVDLTEVEVWPVRLKGAPDVVSRDLVRFVNITHAAASFIQTDDLEAFERCQEGLKTSGAEWVLVAKGLGDEVHEGEGVYFGDRSSEVGQRSQHEGWRALMAAPQPVEIH